MNKTAFSLIEISITILIIGILIAGISNGTDLYRDFKINTINSITQNSRVPRINDLILWLETTSDKSFKLNANSEISIWYDNNYSSITKNNATAQSQTNYPKYVANIFNSVIPGVRFDGQNDFLNFDSSKILNSNFTFFVVEQRMSSAIHKYYIGGSNGKFHLGYINSTTIRVGKYGFPASDFFDINIPAYSNPIPRIHTYSHNSTTGKKYWINGSSNPIASSNNTENITEYNGVIGQTENVHYYMGDIAEIIIYSRDLSTKERLDVEEYLGKKFMISVN
jgi:prepilin-type N-terminal cleavage/methylation domain-containing protein